MVVNGRGLKRMKRRVTADLNDFLTFPAGEVTAAEPFRTGVRTFLLRHALLPPPSSLIPHLLTWQMLFRVGEGSGGDDACVCVDVVEEDVVRARSVYCDQCRVVGWSGNPVCGKRYHFIIKADGASIGGYNKPCAGCGAFVHLSDSRCKSCNHVLTTEDVEEWMYNQLDDTSHLLHAVVHMNGYGHILRVNGREGGSHVLSGRHIMDFWDRLCKALGVRQVSVMDVSKKYGCELRLLHSVIKGHPWYGDWGYAFGGGSYAITHEAYKDAIKTLANMPLSALSSQARKPRTHLHNLIAFYQSLSDQELVTYKDLFHCVAKLLHESNKNCAMVDYHPTKKVKFGDSRALCVWNMSDIVRVEEAMFKVLKAVSGSSWVSWRSLRGAVFRVGPPELLEYCLKELKGKQADNGTVVNARYNPDSGGLEYRLEPNSSTTVNCSIASSLSEDNLIRDLKYLYEALLHPQFTVNHVPSTKKDVVVYSAMKILDCKQFVKNYHPENSFIKANPDSLILSCKPELTEENDISPPPELIILPPNATLGDVKNEASKAFQEVYLILRRFQAEEVVGYRGVDESTQIKLLIGSKNESVVNVVGKCLGKSGLSRFRMERGVETWTLDCSCGAKDDDGERMLACDVCGVWQHTRCAGIPDSCVVTLNFVCCKCDGEGGGGVGVVEAEGGGIVGDGGGGRCGLMSIGG
ncbi:putative chromatin regulator PHD family [Helianthus annuus]|uniref:Chromatin regulator PHD family n=1 Tax=Helianthus annuus TaxID=4232 RepID=A0A251SX32_HELAN|nr:PHD finger protein At1g33420 [Helianthus annuus]KAF5775459.1 putative chromatin regulator PHD family [Helianthus annuus]